MCKRQSTLYINNGSTWQEDTAIINIYATNNRTTNEAKKKARTERKISKSIATLENTNTILIN